MPPRLLIIGGGPIGLEMAVAAVQSQKWDVTIAERGDELCANVAAWEHVRLFSAWNLNVSDYGREALAASGAAVPGCNGAGSGTDYPSGSEFLDRYLRPLGGYLAASDRCTVLLGTAVVSIGKNAPLLKGDTGRDRRRGASFRTLVAAPSGEEIIVSDAVVDASGTYGNGNWLGRGGIPAVGERTRGARIVRTVPDVAGDAARYLDRTTAVFGSGYSAITTINSLRELAIANGGSTVDVHWCTRRGNDGVGPLYEKIENDPLPQRDALSSLANTLAGCGADGGSAMDGESKDGDQRPATAGFRLRYHPRVQLESIASSTTDENSAVNLVLRDVEEPATDEVGRTIIEGVSTVIANVGFRPDTSIFQELQVHQCYASEGPMKLAAALMSASGAGSVDCLAQVAPGKETMVNPEPSFYIVGMKSYGRSSKFLLTIGHEQVRHVMELLNEGLCVSDSSA